MQSRNFRLQKVGDLNWLERNYRIKEVAFALDELIILDASRENRTIELFADMVNLLVRDAFIPIAAGGGIMSMEDAELLFKNGADKIVLNSILYDDPILVENLAKTYGSQSIVASVDYKTQNNETNPYIKNGTVKVNLTLEEYLKYIVSLGVGEIYLNSIEKDGTGFGYDFETIDNLSNIINLPLIIAGGAGNETHLLNGLINKGVDAVATANLFNFIGEGLPNARKKIIDSGENIAKWDVSI